MKLFLFHLLLTGFSFNAMAGNEIVCTGTEQVSGGLSSISVTMKSLQANPSWIKISIQRDIPTDVEALPSIIVSTSEVQKTKTRQQVSFYTQGTDGQGRPHSMTLTYNKKNPSQAQLSVLDIGTDLEQPQLIALAQVACREQEEAALEPDCDSGIHHLLSENDGDTK